MKFRRTARAGAIQGPAFASDREAYVLRSDPTLFPGGMLYDDGVHRYAVAMK